MLWQDWILPILSAGFGTAGFSILYHVTDGKLPLCALGGMLTWGAYLALRRLALPDPVCYGLASLLGTMYAHLLARCLKTPALVFSLPASIPLIPGGSLFTTMQQAALGDWKAFGVQGLNTLLLAAAIALGLICGAWLDRIFALAFFHAEQKRGVVAVDGGIPIREKNRRKAKHDEGERQ